MFNGGMGNMQGMMKKVQKLQADMAKMQEELKLRTIETTVGGGAVTVVVSGKKEVVSVKIDPSAVDPEDVEMLEDLLVAAVNEGMRKIDEMTEAEMGKLTGGMKMAGHVLKMARMIRRWPMCMTAAGVCPVLVPKPLCVWRIILSICRKKRCAVWQKHCWRPSGRSVCVIFVIILPMPRPVRFAVMQAATTA